MIAGYARKLVSRERHINKALFREGKGKEADITAKVSLKSSDLQNVPTKLPNIVQPINIRVYIETDANTL